MAEWKPDDQQRFDQFSRQDIGGSAWNSQGIQPSPPVMPPGMPAIDPLQPYINQNNQYGTQTNIPMPEPPPGMPPLKPARPINQNPQQHHPEHCGENQMLNDTHNKQRPQHPDQINVIARIRGNSQAPLIRGYVEFTPWRDGTLVTVRMNGLKYNENKSGFYAMHIHDGHDCGSDVGKNSFESAGSHLNPTHAPHPLHAGDLPPLLASAKGEAFSRVYTDRFTPQELVGHTVIIHSNSDDFRSQPSGDAGNRIACGEIIQS